MTIFAFDSQLAICRELSSNHTDLFVSCGDGTLAVCTVVGNGIWGTPLPICAPQMAFSSNTRIATLGVPSATIAAIVDANGAINLFTRITLNGSWAQAVITPDDTAIPNASLAFVPNNAGPIILAFVDAAGKLSVCTRAGIDQWHVQALTGANFAVPGTFVAASMQRTIVKEGFPASSMAISSIYTVDASGALQRFWMPAGGQWEQDQMSASDQYLPSSAIAVLSRGAIFDVSQTTDIGLVDADGSLTVVSGGTGQWQSTKLTAPGFTLAGACVAAVSGLTPRICVASKSEALNVFSAEADGPWSFEFSSSPGQLSPVAAIVACPQYGAGMGSGDPVDILLVNTAADLMVFSSSPDEPKLWFGKRVFSSDDFATSAGTSSNAIISNYPLPIPILSTEMAVTEQITFAEKAPSRGFSFQLNCYSYTGAYFAWQQYIICAGIVKGTSTMHVYAVCNHWDVNLNAVIYVSVLLGTLPFPKIPAGYRFQIEIVANGVGAIETVAQAVFDENDTMIMQSVTNLLQVTKLGSSDKVTPDELSPVIGFQMDVVGFSTGYNAALDSGAGVISYSSSGPLFPGQGKLQSIMYTATAETSNVRYQFLSKAPALNTSQAFAAVVPPQLLFGGKWPQPPVPLRFERRQRALPPPP